jgi:predicted DNA-binding transcriptional regulator YafY
MGYRIETTMGPYGGYRLDAGAEMPPLLFDDDQALASRAPPALGEDIGEAAVRALATMRQVLPSRLRHRLDAIDVTTVGRPGDSPVAAVSLDVLLALTQALRDRVTVRFKYLPRGEGEAQPLRIEPHHLVASHGRLVPARVGSRA